MHQKKITDAPHLKKKKQKKTIFFSSRIKWFPTTEREKKNRPSALNRLYFVEYEYVISRTLYWEFTIHSRLNDLVHAPTEE